MSGEVEITPTLRNQRIMLMATGAVVVGTLVILSLLGKLLLTLGLSAVIAYMLLPVARLMERAMPWRGRHPGLSRTISILIIFIVGLGVGAGVLISIIPPTVREAGLFIEEFPSFFNDARIAIEGWIAVYSDRIPEEMREGLEERLANIGSVLLEAGWNGVRKTIGVVFGAFSLIVGLATAPILIYYLMKDSGSINSALCSPFPSAMRPYLLGMLDIANQTVGAYIRGQLTLGLVVGSVVGVALFLLGVPFSFFLGIVAAITELIPIIGPWIGGAVGVLVTLATAPDKVLWVILLYLIVQLLENAVLVPRIQGNALKLHPIAVILVVIVSSQYFGIFGIILGPPLVAMAKGMLVYFFQEWNRQEEEVLEALDEEGSGEA